jgi:hypothetical protein
MKGKYKVIIVLLLIFSLFAGMAVSNQAIPLFLIPGNWNIQENWINAVVPVPPDILGILLNAYVVKIHAVEPSVPASVPLYKGTLNASNAFFIADGSILTQKNSTPSAEEAPLIAQRILIQYGGLPPDAALYYSNISYLIESGPNNTIISQWPSETDVIYNRNIDGMPTYGAVDKIEVELGENGTPLQIYKVWRNLEYLGNTTCIISPNEAVEEIHEGNIIDPLPDYGININNITLGYYESSRSDPEIYLQPVWIFSGAYRNGDLWALAVPAGMISHFDIGLSTNTTPLAVSFTSDSTGAPTQWHWDFGDGSISTQQNPVHEYSVPGDYTVTLTISEGNCENFLSKMVSVPAASESANTTNIEDQLVNSLVNTTKTASNEGSI